MDISSFYRIEKNNIFLRAIFTSIRYLSEENIAFRGTEHFEGTFLKILKLRKNEIPKLESWLHMLTDNTRKIYLLSWHIQNEIIEIFSHTVLRELIKQIDGCYSTIVSARHVTCWYLGHPGYFRYLNFI